MTWAGLYYAAAGLLALTAVLLRFLGDAQLAGVLFALTLVHAGAGADARRA